MSKLLILNYHKIYTDSRDFAVNGNPFWVSYEDFQSQLDFLQERKVAIVSIADWTEGHIIEDLSVALTFDDGHKSDFEIVKDELLKRKFTASFYPICSFLDLDGYLSKNELIQIHKLGFNIGSHSLSHPNIKELNSSQWDLELTQSKSILEGILKSEVSTFAWPYGLFPSDHENLLMNSGYQNGLTTTKKINSNPESFLLHRWNVKDVWTIREFERVLFQKFPTFHLKSLLSKLKI